MAKRIGCVRMIGLWSPKGAMDAIRHSAAKSADAAPPSAGETHDFGRGAGVCADTLPSWAAKATRARW